MKRLLFLLLLPLSLFAQGYSVENFSGGTNGATPTATTISNGWYGNRGSGNDTAFGCAISTVTCAVRISNSSGAITYSNTSVCGSVPPNSGGPNALILDYSTTLGTGVASQDVLFNFPSAQSTVVQAVVWFCSDIPVSANFGTTFDGFILIAGVSHISNYVCGGGDCGITLESTPGQTAIQYVPGTWVQQTFQYVTNGACADSVGHTDCIRLRLYDVNGNQITNCKGGGTGCGEVFSSTTGVADYITLGNLNAATLPAGHHVQFMNLKICNLDCTAAQFPLLENPVPAWDGIIEPSRAVDWTQAGIPGNNLGTLPSSAWSQFGTTLAAGSYAGSTITANMVGCSNQFYQLGAGTFTVTGGINVPTNCELRGQGANSTFIVGAAAAASCRSANAMICIKNTGDNTLIGNTPSVDCNWTAGYAKGATQITLSSCTGAGITSITPGTLLAINQCGTGFTGANNCTGTATDNGNLFMCLDKYATTTGCSTNGGGTYERPSIELPVVTAINTSTGVATISPPLSLPNYSSGQTPQAQIIHPTTLAGVKDLSIDLSAAGTDADCVELFDAYKVWIRGVKCVNNKFESFFIMQTANFIVEDNYLYGTTATPPSGYGIRPFYSAYGLIANNISQNVYTPMFSDSPTTGIVWAYNYVINNSNPGNNFMNQAFTDHWPNYYTLLEGNIANQYNPDDVHGNASVNTTFRNFFTGWESTPSTPKNSNTVAIADIAFTRYHHHLLDVYGTPGYHNAYSNLGSNTSTLWLGKGNGATTPAIPNDALTASTTLRWGSYNVVDATVRWCGNSLDTGWGTTCASTSEAPTAASTFPNTVPVIGDTAIKEAPPPSSFIFTSVPSWYPNAKPFPLIGPDVTGGNIIQCGGALNTVGKFDGVPAIATSTNCTAGGTGWAGHVNSNPAMDCALTTMGMPPDGSGAVLPFDAGACYGGAAPSPIASFSPNPLPIGQVPVGLTSNASQTETLTNTGTANLVVTAVTPGAIFALVNNTCGTSFTLTPGQSCTFQVTATPTSAVGFTGGITFSDNAGNPDVLPVTGTGTGQPAPSAVQFAGNMTSQGTVAIQ